MKISTKGRYGIRLMLSLALHYDKGTLALKSIAREQDISEKYLEQIINPLTKSGLVKSYRGARREVTFSHENQRYHHRRSPENSGRFSFSRGLCGQPHVPQF